MTKNQKSEISCLLKEGSKTLLVASVVNRTNVFDSRTSSSHELHVGGDVNQFLEEMNYVPEGLYDGFLWFTDGSWAKRESDEDGNSWWEITEMPPIPEKLKTL